MAVEFGEPVVLSGQTSRQKNLYFHIRKKASLYRAWQQVYENGIKSRSEETRTAVKNFSIDIDRRISRIQRLLQQSKYKFHPARGVPISRTGKRPRPIVVSEIEDRIVQRSILDVIQSIASLKHYVSVPTSFGGIEGRKVREAIEAICLSVKSGCTYYIRSDIKDFFSHIPRGKVIQIITDLLPDSSLNEILDAASRTELENLLKLGHAADLFPTYELGVAQGCCLSPLFGNVLLHDFDEELNKRFERVVCLRYIDDFIILGPSAAIVRTAFKMARRILKQYRMDAYEPSEEGGKAKEGLVSKGLEYLGCFVNNDYVHPSPKSRTEIKKKIRDLLETHAKRLRSTSWAFWAKEYSLSETLQEINNILMGWGNQYSFCNSKQLFRDMDREIDSYIEKYIQEYNAARIRLSKSGDRDGLRKIMGVHLLSESKSHPIRSSGK